jgi:hypothetical protein
VSGKDDGLVTTSVRILLPRTGRFAIAARRIDPTFEPPLDDAALERMTRSFDDGFGSWVAGHLRYRYIRSGADFVASASFAHWDDALGL